MIRQVITLASPFRFRTGDRTYASALDDYLAPVKNPFPHDIPEHSRPDLPVPSTCVYTRTDGIVRCTCAWRRTARCGKTSRSAAPTAVWAAISPPSWRSPTAWLEPRAAGGRSALPASCGTCTPHRPTGRRIGGASRSDRPFCCNQLFRDTSWGGRHVSTQSNRTRFFCFPSPPGCRCISRHCTYTTRRQRANPSRSNGFSATCRVVCPRPRSPASHRQSSARPRLSLLGRGCRLRRRVSRRSLALPASGDLAELWKQASRLHSIPSTWVALPWELYIIEGLQPPDFPPDSFALYIKVHHSAIDGISGIELMGALNDLDPTGPRGTSRPLAARSHADAGISSPAHLGQLGGPARAFLREDAEIAAQYAACSLGRPRRSQHQTAPITRLNAPATTHRVAGGFRFELATAKAMRSAVPGSTVNDVVLAIVGGGLRQYLESTNELPARSLMASVPISMRTEKEAGLPGNMISMMIVSLGTDIADPLERLKVIQQSTAASKEIGTPSRLAPWPRAAS